MSEGDADGHPYDAMLSHVLGAPAMVTSVVPVSKGASKRIEIIDAVVAGAPSQVVLRAEPTDDVDPTGMEREAAAIRAASAAGVPVPEVFRASSGDAVIPAPYVVTSFVEGESLPRPILRTFAGDDGHDGEAFAEQLGDIAARIHTMEVPEGLFEARPDELAEWQSQFDAYGIASPAFELAFAHLANTRQPPTDLTFVHGDLRMGNLMVRDGRVEAVLDWELAHIGDPVSDLGWVSAVQWRFGGPGEAAGVGSREALLRGYREAGGRPARAIRGLERRTRTKPRIAELPSQRPDLLDPMATGPTLILAWFGTFLVNVPLAQAAFQMSLSARSPEEGQRGMFRAAALGAPFIVLGAVIGCRRDRGAGRGPRPGGRAPVPRRGAPRPAGRAVLPRHLGLRAGLGRSLSASRRPRSVVTSAPPAPERLARAAGALDPLVVGRADRSDDPLRRAPHRAVGLVEHPGLHAAHRCSNTQLNEGAARGDVLLPPMRDRLTMARRIRSYVTRGGTSTTSTGSRTDSAGRKALATMGARGGKTAAKRWTDPESEYARQQRAALAAANKRKSVSSRRRGYEIADWYLDRHQRTGEWPTVADGMTAHSVSRENHQASAQSRGHRASPRPQTGALGKGLTP